MFILKKKRKEQTTKTMQKFTSYFNPFMPIVYSLPYQLEKFISNLMSWVVSFNFNHAESDQRLLSMMSDLVLHRLPMSHKKDTMGQQFENGDMCCLITNQLV